MFCLRTNHPPATSFSEYSPVYTSGCYLLCAIIMDNLKTVTVLRMQKKFQFFFFQINFVLKKICLCEKYNIFLVSNVIGHILLEKIESTILLLLYK